MSELLTAHEAAQRLKISARKVYALASSGELACHRFGASVRFDTADLDAYKTACRLPATTRAAETKSALIPAGMTQTNFLGRLVLVPIPPPPPPPPSARELRKQRKAEEQRRLQDRRALVTFHANKRRAAKLRRTPLWVDWDAIASMYDKAQRLTVETGIPHHVDHIIPLQGRLVSGLHVHGNLQVLTGAENSRKRNHYEVEA